MHFLNAPSFHPVWGDGDDANPARGDLGSIRTSPNDVRLPSCLICCKVISQPLVVGAESHQDQDLNVSGLRLLLFSLKPAVCSRPGALGSAMLISYLMCSIWFLFTGFLFVGEQAAFTCPTQVEETKLVLRMAVVWLTTLVPSTIFAQVNTLFVKQGTTLDRRLGRGGFQIPAASLGSFITITMLLSVPLYDRYFVPFMRRRTGNPRGITLLQRLGVGFAIQVLVTMVASLVEMRRMRAARAHGGAAGPKDVVPMSIFWLLPQYVLLGVGDVFNAVGVLEFFYDQSPEDMQSLGTTFFTSSIGMGNFLNSFLVTVVDRATRGAGAGGRGKSWIGQNLNDSHLDYYYGFLMAISAINMVVFLWISSGYHYKKESIEVVTEVIMTRASTSQVEIVEATVGEEKTLSDAHV